MRVLADDSTAGYTIFAENMLETVADNSEECNIRYSKFPDADIEVSVSVRFTNSVSWRIAIKNLTDFCIEYIDFPLLSLKNNLKGSGKDAEIFWGFFDIVMQPFMGDWQDAAEIYRTWFEKNKLLKCIIKIKIIILM